MPLLRIQVDRNLRHSGFYTYICTQNPDKVIKWLNVERWSEMFLKSFYTRFIRRHGKKKEVPNNSDSRPFHHATSHQKHHQIKTTKKKIKKKNPHKTDYAFNFINKYANLKTPIS